VIPVHAVIPAHAVIPVDTWAPAIGSIPLIASTPNAPAAAVPSPTSLPSLPPLAPGPEASVLVGILAALALLLWTWPRRSTWADTDSTAPGSTPGGPEGVLASVRERLRGTGSTHTSREHETERLAVAEALAAALGAGLDVRSAHEIVTHAADHPARVALRPGADEEAHEAWLRCAGGGRVAHAVGHALQVSIEVGAPVRGAVGAALDSSRQQLAQDGAVGGAVAGARATGRLLSALPVAGPLAVLGLGLDAGAVYGSPAALACTVAGVALTVAGHRWVSRQVATAQRETVVS